MTDAAAAFNAAWALIDQPDRTDDDIALMLNLVHGSRHLWQAGGSARERSIGDWQIARAYACIGQGDLSLLYARSALRQAQDHAADPFIIAAAYEGLARACAVAGLPDAATHADRARSMAMALQDAEDRDVILADLRSHGP